MIGFGHLDGRNYANAIDQACAIVLGNMMINDHTDDSTSVTVGESKMCIQGPPIVCKWSKDPIEHSHDNMMKKTAFNCFDFY